MGKPAARITDMHACPMVTPGLPPIPHVGGPIIVGSPTVLTGSLPQARVSDNCVCVGPPDIIVMGSAGVFVNKLPAARMGDQTAHGGVIVLGLPTVLIGEVGSASVSGSSGGGAGGSSGAQAAAPGSHAASSGGGGGAAPAMSSTDATAMAGGMVKSASDGAPFCEICFKLAQERKKSMAAS